jgi:hypothetical protein
METRVARLPEAQRRNYQLAGPIQTFAARKGSPLRYEQMNADARQRISTQALDAHKFRDDRAKWEATGQTNPKAARPPAEHVAAPAAEHPGAGKPAAERSPELIAPRAVHLTEPERVKLPSAPAIQGRERTTGGGGEKAPAQPAEEMKHKTEVRSAPKAEPKEEEHKR